MASNDHFFRGQNVKLRFYQSGAPVYIAAKNWTVSQNAAEIADGVNGEKRDRLDLVTNYYEVDFDVFQSDQAVMNALIAAQEADDAAGLPLKQTFAVQIEHRDGTRAAYICSEARLGPWKKTNSSRQDAVMLGLKARFRFYKPVPSI